MGILPAFEDDLRCVNRGIAGTLFAACAPPGCGESPALLK